MWKTVQLGDLYDVGSSKRVLKADWKDEGIPFYRGREITALSVNDYVDNDLFITEEHYVALSAKSGVPSADDIMITAIGTIGNTYIVKPNHKFYFKDASVLWLRQKADISSRYIQYWLKTDDFFRQLDKGNGATVDTLTIKKLASVALPLPPLAEQQRIVAKLDAAFAEIDKAVEVVQQQMQQAHSLHQQKTDSVFGGISGDKKTLDDVCNLITCGVAARPEYVEEGIPFLSAQNVKKGQVIYSNHKHITQEKHQELTKKNKPMRGDLLYTRVGSFGEAAVVESDIEFSIFVSLTLIKTKNELNPYYLKHYLNSQRLKKLASNSLSGSGVGNLNVGTVRKFPITIPSIEQQLEVVESLNDMADSTERLYETYQRKAAQLQSLKSTILAKELQPPQSEAA